MSAKHSFRLLDAAGNDGDRGSLTATFAELLVTEGNAQNYIPLLDRLVEDYEALFEGEAPMIRRWSIRS